VSLGRATAASVDGSPGLVGGKGVGASANGGGANGGGGGNVPTRNSLVDLKIPARISQVQVVMNIERKFFFPLLLLLWGIY